MGEIRGTHGSGSDRGEGRYGNEKSTVVVELGLFFFSDLRRFFLFFWKIFSLYPKSYPTKRQSPKVSRTPGNPVALFPIGPDGAGSDQAEEGACPAMLRFPWLTTFQTGASRTARAVDGPISSWHASRKTG